MIGWARTSLAVGKPGNAFPPAYDVFGVRRLIFIAVIGSILLLNAGSAISLSAPELVSFRGPQRLSGTPGK